MVAQALGIVLTPAPCPSMYEIRQLDIPGSFMELYTRQGRPSEPRQFVEERFEACEDLARGVSGLCVTLAIKDELGPDEVLARCHAGLLLTPQTLSASEAAWVIHRTAELLEWERPTL